MSTISKFSGRVVCTKAQFDALAEKDPNKEYLVIDGDTYGSGKLYMHSLTCSDYQNAGYTVYISAYSTKQEEFTLDYIKANPNCLKGAISVVVNDNGDASFDRVISGISVSNSGAPFDFSISTYGAAPIARQLNFTSDDVTEL